MHKWLAVLLVVASPAWGQGMAGNGGSGIGGNIIGGGASGTAAITGGTANNLAIGGSSTENTTNTVSLTGSSVNNLNTNTLTINVPNSATTAVQINTDITCSTAGAGTLTGGGHVPCLQVENYAGISSQALQIPIESVVGTVTGSTAVTNQWNFLAKASENAVGSTVTNWVGITNTTNNLGTVSLGALVFCQAWTGTPPSQNFCLYNQDSAQRIYTAGDMVLNGPVYTNSTNAATGSTGYFEMIGVASSVSPLPSSSGVAYVSAVGGATLAGNGSVCDSELANNAGSTSICVLHGTTNTALVSPIILKNYTVAGLPACNGGTQYGVAVVTDALTPTYNGTLTGGSSTVVLALCNGSAWLAH